MFWRKYSALLLFVTVIRENSQTSLNTSLSNNQARETQVTNYFLLHLCDMDAVVHTP